jgi:hypothetical protein
VRREISLAPLRESKILIPFSLIVPTLKRYILLILKVCRRAGVHKFSKNPETTSKVCRQEGDMKQVPY